MADLMSINPEDLWADELPESTESLWEEPAPQITPEQAQEHLQQIGLQRARQQGRAMPSWIQGLSTALQGITLGQGADIGAAIYGALTGLPVEQREQAAAALKAGIASQREENPVLSMATGAATAAPYAAIAPVFPSRLATGAAAIGLGTGMSALQGYGEAERDRVSHALESGLIAGGISAVPVVGAPMARGIGKMLPGDKKAAAMQKVAQAFRQDSSKQTGFTPEQVRANQLEWLGKEGRLVDTGSENVRGLLDVVASMPGKTKEATAQVVKGRKGIIYQNLVNKVDEQLGTKGKDYLAATNQIRDAQMAASRPLYDMIDNAAVTADDRLIAALKNVRDYHGEAEKMLRHGRNIDIDLANIQPGDRVPLSALEDVYRSLRDAGITARIDGKGSLSHALGSSSRRFSDIMDDYAPKIDGKSVLREARQEYAGPARVLELAEQGRKAMKSDLLELRTLMDGMTKSETESFRIGLAQGLKEQMGAGESGLNKILNYWKDPNTRERIRVALGEHYPEFDRAVRAGRQLKQLQTSSVGKGSQTFARAAAESDLGLPLQMAADAKTGGVFSLLSGVLSGMKDRATLPEPMRNEIGRILLSRGADARQQNILLENALRQIERGERIRGGAGVLFGAGSGRRSERQQ